MAKIEIKKTVKQDVKLTLTQLYKFFNTANNLKDKIKFHALITIELNK